FVFEKDSMPSSYFDIVLCRNRLIYYNQNGQKKALDSIYKSLKNKGYLFLGLKENFGDWKNKNRFSRFEKECNIFTKKK
ncbi:MAG: CheR family methyltransferase, partial [Bacteroidota bacterium]|nr:CheR family methyltransferase [Bacteroidota bacterium]